MSIYFEFGLISLCVFAISRLIPLYCFNIKQSKIHIYIRIGEEITILFYSLFVVFYLFFFFIDFDFILNGDLDKNIDERYTPFVQSLEPFLLWNFWYFFMLLGISFCPPVKKGDFFELITHHVTAMLLIAAAFYHSWLGVSAWVILINSMFDIFLSFSRIAYKLDHWSQVPLFGMAIISHFVLRISLFPYRIVQTMMMTTYMDDASYITYPPFFLMIPLWGLYLYWGWCMIRVCYLRLWKGKHDVDYSDGQQTSSIGQKLKKEK